MRIAILCEYPTVLGGENSLLGMLQHLPRAEATVIAPREGRLADRLAGLGIPHAPWSAFDEDGHRRARSIILSELQRLVAELSPDLLHANSLAMGDLAGALRSEVRVAATAHLRDIVRLNPTAVAELNRNDALVAVSQKTREFHVRQGLAAQRTHVIYNGLDVDDFGSGDRSDLRNELGLPPATRLAGIIGQISLRKGQDLFVKAAIEISLRRSDVHWLIVGERYSQKAETAEYEAQMRNAVAQAGLDSQFHWLGYREDVPGILASLDLLVHPAREEPLGRVLLEAGAARLPVVATDVGGTAEIIENGRSGLLFARDDRDALILAIESLLDDPDRAAALSTELHATIVRHFNLRRQAQQLAELWQTVIQSQLHAG